MGTVAVFGATGFVGAAVVERLLAQGHHEVRPIIHRTGKAWRLARRGLSLRAVDICDANAVQGAVSGASHVVNCTLGPRDVMIGGLDNLLSACRSANVERFVHLSSVSVWGDRDPGTVLSETDAPSSALTLYGKIKAEQDKLIAAACRSGLSAVLLAPPMIGGPHSPFLLGVVDALRRDALALIEGGHLPCSLCDVRNVAYAVELGLECEGGEGQPYLLTDDSEIDWSDMVSALMPIAEKTQFPPTITREEALALAPSAGEERLSPIATFRALLRAIATPQARMLLQKDPLLVKAYEIATRRMPSAVATRVRKNFGRKAAAGAAAVPTRLDAHLLGVQTRAVRQEMTGAREVLGYRPIFNSTESLASFVRWQDQILGREDDVAWPLLRELWQPSRAGA